MFVRAVQQNDETLESSPWCLGESMARNEGRRALEVVGALGVIGSLVFVGLELRESSRATRAATDAEIAAQFVDINISIYTSDQLAADFVTAGEAGHPSLAPAESRTRMLAFYRALFHIWSNTHRQYLNGTVNPLLFQGVQQELTQYAVPESPDVPAEENEVRRNMAWAWESQRFIYNPVFQNLVDSTIAALR